MLAAGGSGERARRGPGGEPKQFRPLGDRPLLRWALHILVDAGCDPVIVVVPEEDLTRAASALQGVPAEVVAGGTTRQQSVAHGVARVAAPRVVVHDAARPFATVDMVHRALAALDGVPGAVVAVPIDETVKTARDGRVVQTLERSSLRLVQTPQAFHTEVLREAQRAAEAEGWYASDDAELLERYGYEVALVDGARRNLKITYEEDWLLAEAIIAARR